MPPDSYWDPPEDPPMSECDNCDIETYPNDDGEFLCERCEHLLGLDVDDLVTIIRELEEQ